MFISPFACLRVALLSAKVVVYDPMFAEVMARFVMPLLVLMFVLCCLLDAAVQRTGYDKHPLQDSKGSFTLFLVFLATSSIVVLREDCVVIFLDLGLFGSTFRNELPIWLQPFYVTSPISILFARIAA